MTDDAPQPLRLKLQHTPSPNFSPLLAQLPQEAWPKPLPACASCPASMWRATQDRIECLCRTANRISWDGRQKPTLFCDCCWRSNLPHKGHLKIPHFF